MAKKKKKAAPQTKKKLAPAKMSAAKKVAAKKFSAKKASPKKAAAKSAPAKGNFSKRTPAKRTPAPKEPAIKAPKAKIDVRQIFAETPVIEREGNKIRVLVGKAGLDGHDRGAKVIARACRDAGFEVVYTGLHQTPEMIVNTAIQEDVDVVGLSILSGAHNHLVPEVIRHLRGQGVNVGKDMLVVVGGIIPDTDFESLRKAGVSMVFTPGASVDSIVTFIREHVQPKG